MKEKRFVFLWSQTFRLMQFTDLYMGTEQVGFSGLSHYITTERDHSNKTRIKWLFGPYDDVALIKSLDKGDVLITHHCGREWRSSPPNVSVTAACMRRLLFSGPGKRNISELEGSHFSHLAKRSSAGLCEAERGFENHPSTH